MTGHIQCTVHVHVSIGKECLLYNNYYHNEHNRWELMEWYNKMDIVSTLYIHWQVTVTVHTSTDLNVASLMTSVTRYNIPLNRRNLKSQGKACYMLFLQPNQQRMLKTEQRTVAYTCTIYIVWP